MQKIKNLHLAEQVISQLVYFHGVRTFCLCPGGRNAPLISLVEYAKGLELLSFFDERSAGFFALGSIKKEGWPSAVITTSGTAVAELLPAVIEAYYSHIPLVVITADRPAIYRGKGAPQSIEQKGLFGPYVCQQWDLENTLDFDLTQWSALAPCHINICFDEPLLDMPSPSLDFLTRQQFDSLSTSKARTKTAPFRKGICKKAKPFSILSGDKLWGPGAHRIKNNKQEKKQVLSFFKKSQKPLCILTELIEQIQPRVENMLSKCGWPVYAEALSHLRESNQLCFLRSGEDILKWLVCNKKIDGVIRIGRSPVTRFWRDLEKTYHYLPVLSVSDQSYAGLSRGEPAISFKTFFEEVKKKLKKPLRGQHSPQVKKADFFDLKGKKVSHSSSSLWTQPAKAEILKEDEKRYKKLNYLLKKHPLSEPALVQDFSKKIPQNSLLFLGNSLPIREWNGVADDSRSKSLKYIANRGVNGIDGVISTFLGTLEKGRQNWCLVGDLSVLYDLSALWIFSQLKKKPACFIVVVNNGGGQIFSSLFSNPSASPKTSKRQALPFMQGVAGYVPTGQKKMKSADPNKIFLNEHNLCFRYWAKMWDFHYYKLKRWPDKLSFLCPAIIELKVDPKCTKQLTDELKSSKKE